MNFSRDPRLNFSSFMFSFVDIEREFVRALAAALFEIGHQPLISEVERMRVLPVVARNPVQSFHQMLVVDFDGQFAPAVKASGLRLIEPTIARFASASSILACSLRCLSLWTLTPTSLRMRIPPRPRPAFPS